MNQERHLTAAEQKSMFAAIERDIADCMSVHPAWRRVCDATKLADALQ